MFKKKKVRESVSWMKAIQSAVKKKKLLGVGGADGQSDLASIRVALNLLGSPPAAAGGAGVSSPAGRGGGSTGAKYRARDSLASGCSGAAVRTSDILINPSSVSNSSSPAVMPTPPRSPPAEPPAAAADAAGGGGDNQSPLARAASLLLEEARMSGDFQEVVNPYTKNTAAAAAASSSSSSSSPVKHRTTARITPPAAAGVNSGGEGGAGAGRKGAVDSSAAPRVTVRERKQAARGAGSTDSLASELPKLRPLSVRYPSEDELIEAVLQEQRNSVHSEQHQVHADHLRALAESETAAATEAAAVPAEASKEVAAMGVVAGAGAGAGAGKMDLGDATVGATGNAAAAAIAIPAPPVAAAAAASAAVQSESHLGVDDELKLKRRCEGLIRNIRVKAPEISPTHVHILFVAAADYEATDDDEMTFSAADEMLVHRQDDDGWWLASRVLDGVTGYVPATYMKALSRCRAELVGDPGGLAQMPRSSQYILDESDEL